jgi:hypothetical protein
MKKTIKAILIDSEKKEVREVELINENGSYNRNMYNEIKCEYITSACGEIFSQVNHALFVDDEGLLKTIPIGAFSISMHPLSYVSQTLSGNGIIVGIDEEGESISHTLNVQAIRDIIIWEPIENLPSPSFEFTSF